MGFIETVLSDTKRNKDFFFEIVKVLRQQNYDTAVQDKEIDLIRQMYSPSGLVIQERVSQATSRLDPGAKLPAEAKNGWRHPLATIRVTSNFGYRIHPIFGTRKLHAGIDLSASEGTAVFAAKDGNVIHAGWEGGYGLSVVIDHGSGVTSRYAHNSKLLVVPGDSVKQGTQIAKSGSTGFSTGGHVHFEILVNKVPQNPTDFIKF
jgi:murein DD-endopeptidase MepM/ murein hydrolase activator NlpD